MKNVRFSIIIIILLVSLNACPPLEEDELSDVITFTGQLDRDAWFDILDTIATEGRNIKLDLKKSTYVDGNVYGGLIAVTVNDGGLPKTYIAFDPVPAIKWGKDKIVSIILPDAAQYINPATLNNVSEENENVKRNSAFRNFTKLDSVSAANVSHIGNYAFTDCVSLKKLDFPKLALGIDPSGDEPADIGHFAFKGCTSLTEVKFNLAAVIGRYAFKDCTSLTAVDFPSVLIIGQNAFEGCTSLVEAQFEKVTSIGKESFKNCKNLKNLCFITSDSMFFDKSAFAGCTAFQTLDVGNAKKVFFNEGALENTSRSIDILLYDDDHPQTEMFLGTGDSITLRDVFLYVVIGAEKITFDNHNSIAYFIKDKYPSIGVGIRSR